MPKLDLAYVARTAGGHLHGGKEACRIALATGYAFDTRMLAPGDLFFALKGEERDGHAFVADAESKGAVGAVVDHRMEGVPEDWPQIVVASTLTALQRLATEVRRSLTLPVVAISGSNGKTTTKDMLAMLLETRMRVHKSPGNFNNHIGVPLSVLGLDETSEVLVVELGSNHRGEIRRLCEIAKPTVGLITNVGRAHIGLFGSLREIALEKTDIVRCLDGEGKGVVNADDAAIREALEGLERELLRFGIREQAEFRATDIELRDISGVRFRIAGTVFALKTPGIHSVYNALAAVATASLFGILRDEAARVLAGFEPVRLKPTRVGDITVIDDTYNANPDSVRAALDVISGMDARRKVFIIGEMLELGKHAQDLHKEIGRLVASAGVGLLVGIGDLTSSTLDEAVASGLKPDAALFFGSKGDARDGIRRLLKPGDLVLVKGSRLAGLEDICEFIRQDAIRGRT